MEVLYLLCSIVSTFFTSFTLSLLLLVRTFLHCIFPIRPSVSSSNDDTSVSLYEGNVWHDRRLPVRHSFKYNVRYALINLDNVPQTPQDHFSAGEARRVAATNGPVFLLTIPRSVGYEQNPLSLYYCYDLKDSTHYLKRCIAEDMLGNWSIKASAPGESLYVAISVQHSELGDYFSATLKAKRVSSLVNSDRAIFFWLMPHKVAVWIYWHAFKLWWKNVPFIQHPRYTTPTYKREAILRDQKLQCCQAVGWDDDCQLKVEGSDLHFRSSGNRCFAWREAQWPWS